MAKKEDFVIEARRFKTDSDFQRAIVIARKRFEADENVGRIEESSRSEGKPDERYIFTIHELTEAQKRERDKK